MKITKVFAREIVDCRGLPALECELILDNLHSIVASVPSGTSRGSHEVCEKRDGGDRLCGLGLLSAINTIESTIAPMLLNQEPDFEIIDARLLEHDSTKTKEILGGNVTLAVSSAVLKAQSLFEELEPYELIAHMMGTTEVVLPFPMFNIVNGGAHAHNNVRIQEFMVVPIGEHTARSCVEAGMELFQMFGEVLLAQQRTFSVGLEGGFDVDFENDIDALDTLREFLEQATALTGGTYALALDVAASQFYDQNSGLYRWGEDKFSTQEMIGLYSHMISHYPIYSIEDGLSEHDWEGWALMHAQLGSALQIVGDDLFATSTERIAYGEQKNVANAVIIKPNQIGTITQTLQAVQMCKEHEMATIFSHRSVETEDTLIIDLAIGTSASQLKAGGLLRGERVAKYNRLLRIEDRLTSGLLIGN